MKFKYLENPACEFRHAPAGTTRAGPWDPSVRTDIISVSLFRMSNGGYKPFQKYTRGLGVLDRWAGERRMEVRLFAEASLLRDPAVSQALSALPRTRVFVYDCPPHGDAGAHGLFGTMVRFFPLFDFPGNDAGVVLVADADAKPDMSFYDEKIDSMLGPYSGAEAARRVPMMMYHGNFWRGDQFRGGDLPYCYADSIVGLRRANKDILLRFLEELRAEVKRGTAHRLTPYPVEGKEEQKCVSGLCFGIDEHFTNSVLLPELVRRRARFEAHFTHYGIDAFYHAYRPEEKRPAAAPHRRAVVACLAEMYPPRGIPYPEVDRKMFAKARAASGGRATPFVDGFMRRLHEQFSRMEARGEGDAVPGLRHCLARDRAAGCEYYSYGGFFSFPGGGGGGHGEATVKDGVRYGTPPCGEKKKKARAAETRGPAKPSGQNKQKKRKKLQRA